MSRVLIVDDSASLRGQVAAALGAAGHRVAEAGDGLEALERLDGANYDVIVCDVNMPGMGGLDFLTALGERPRRPPVLMLTTEGQPTLIREARARGAAAWMIKPFQPELLRRAVEKLASSAAPQRPRPEAP